MNNLLCAKYYGQNDLRNFNLHITSLITIQVSEQCPNLYQNRKIYERNLRQPMLRAF